MREKLFYPLVLVVIILGALALFRSFTQEQGQTTSTNSQNQTNQDQNSATSAEDADQPTFLVTRVIDGDTIEISGGSRVRYIGIDTPETVDPREEVQCFGKEASDKNKELVEGKEVRLEKDVSETDQYGRLLRYVYVGNTFVNESLVKEGFAKASSYPPDIKYQEKLANAEAFARENNKGLWAACGSTQGIQSSESYRLSPLTGASGCNIKGNISTNEKKEKIYHMPGQQYYSATVIDENKGERWFCSEEEAKQAGWRKSQK
jgi:micrococcal nuclease